jgi:metal-sulfur cluster biosynthetic enzyme
LFARILPGDAAKKCKVQGWPKVVKKRSLQDTRCAVLCFALRNFFVVFVCLILEFQGIVSVVQAESIDGADSYQEKYASLLTSGSQCEKQILQQLHSLQDPELKINIIELGIVRAITCDERKKANTVTIILTSPFCPYVKELVSAIKAASTSVSPEHATQVIVDMKTRWDPSLMSEQAKKQFFGPQE